MYTEITFTEEQRVTSACRETDKIHIALIQVIPIQDMSPHSERCPLDGVSRVVADGLRLLVVEVLLVEVLRVGEGVFFLQ